MTHDSRPPFHIAVPVDSLEGAERFYSGLLGCRIGRRDARWIDFDFFGHQLTVHKVDRPGAAPEEDGGGTRATAQGLSARPENVNEVDGDPIPASHFGVVLTWKAWRDLVEHFQREHVSFLLEPRLRFSGSLGQQHTFFLKDPAGNALEFKAFRDPDRLFSTEDTP
ncbi:MAG: VOC family protein [Sandaracinaceae bacterium]